MFTVASTQLSARANVTASTSKISASSRVATASPKVSTTNLKVLGCGSRANDKTAIVLIERKVPHRVLSSASIRDSPCEENEMCRDC